MGTPEDLRNIRDKFRSGMFGQREVWEQQLEDAAAEIEQLRAALLEVAQGTNEDWTHDIALRAYEQKVPEKP